MISRTGTSSIIFGYNGRDGVITEANGLIYMRARYYSPDMRRFVNADVVAGTISKAVTLNRFAYANGNPVSYVDPFGLEASREGETSLWDSVENWFTENVINPLADIGGKLEACFFYEENGKIVALYTDENNTLQSMTVFVDTDMLPSISEFISNVGSSLAENVGFTLSKGKEITLVLGYYFLATVESGIGYNKDFGDEKPITFFAASGEHWWEFWEWSIGMDVNVNGYGGGISLGGETSINIHLGNVSHEVGINALGRISHKVIHEIDDRYSYTKFSLNGPEIAITAAAIYYGVGALLAGGLVGPVVQASR